MSLRNLFSQLFAPQKEENIEARVSKLMAGLTLHERLLRLEYETALMQIVYNSERGYSPEFRAAVVTGVEKLDDPRLLRYIEILDGFKPHSPEQAALASAVESCLATLRAKINADTEREMLLHPAAAPPETGAELLRPEIKNAGSANLLLAADAPDGATPPVSTDEPGKPS